MIQESILKTILNACKDYPTIAAAYLIGSQASGSARPDSDVDVAILPVSGKTLTIQEQLSLATEIAFQLGLDADVGVLNSRNLVYARETVLKGKRVYAADPGYSDYMEMIFLSMYGQYQEDRKEVLHGFAIE